MTDQKKRQSAKTVAVATSAPDLPPIAAKADDLEAIKKTVDDAAAVCGTLWLSYIFVLFYFAVAAGAVTHADLFFEKSVKLPFLNIELPLLAFFFLAPILFLIVHAYTLAHFVMLTDKTTRFQHVLHAQIDGESGTGIRANLRRQLPSNIFVQFLAGPPNIRDSAFGGLLRAIAWMTLAVAPVLLLLLMQIQFLPYHKSFITWTHRIVLLANVILLVWLWRKIISGREVVVRRLWSFWAWPALGIAACTVLFSWTTATFPGEWQEDFLADWDKTRFATSLHDWAFNLPVDETTRRRSSFFSSTLVLSGLNDYEVLGIDDPEKARWRDFVFHARGRDLKGAIFDYAVLRKVDFEGAYLEDARFFRGQLQGASFNKAHLQGASFFLAQLQGASLDHAQLQGTGFVGAQLQGAYLPNAHLQGSSLEGAQLAGAALDGAQLQGASLEQAWLQGASLQNAQLDGATLAASQLQGASLQFASLRATDLSYAFLWRSDGGEPSTIYAAHVAAVRLAVAAQTWGPLWWDERGVLRPWNSAAYQDLLSKITESVPAGDLRDQALDRVRRLDCANQNFASCDPSSQPPPEAAHWRNSLEDGSVDDATYAKALAAELKALLCSGGDDAAYVLRGILNRAVGMARVPRLNAAFVINRLQATGPEAPNLISFIMSKDCPVSASLTDADKGGLLQIKHYTMKAGQ